MHSYGGLLEPRGPKLALLKSTFYAENFIRRLSWSFNGLYPAISTQFSLVCGSLKSRKKFTKKPYFRVQGRSMSSMLVPPERLSAVLVMMHSKSVSICNRFRARLVHSGQGGTQIWCPRNGGLVEPRGSSLTPLKSMFNAEHFMLRLSWSFLNDFGAIHC